ncbi:cytochrome P450 4C1-like [Diadema antillarum]|uniref:cytochrome P450 4C1-like n=1 Tax=Diadema antillarum TaxID=105358 RepID=UPI003A8493E7
MDLAESGNLHGFCMLGTIIAVTLFTLLAYFSAKFIRVFFLMSKFYGPLALPIIGNAHMLSKDPREYFLFIKSLANEYREKSGGIIRIWFGPLPSLVTYNCKHAEEILRSSRHIKKGYAYNFLRPWLGLGLIVSSGGKWFHRRKMLTPTFHFSILQNFMDVFNEQSNILADKLEPWANKADHVNIFPLATYCALDIICDTAMGKYINAQGDTDNEYVQAVNKMSQQISLRARSPWMWPDVVFRNLEAGAKQRECLAILHGVTRSMIRERLHTCHKPPKDCGDDEIEDIAGERKRFAFLDLLLKMHREDPSFTLEDIKEEVDTFMFAGHDTTAAAISWALLFIGLHPDVQERLHDEMDRVFGDANRPVTTDDLAELSYLTCVVKETLRLFPSVPAIQRKLEDDIVLDGKVVPKEATIMISIVNLHRDPEQFPEPETFNPDRFLLEAKARRHPYAYIPFSAGPRNCIGQKFAMMEAKVVLSNLLRRFSFQSVQTIDEAKPINDLIIRPMEGEILVKVSRRKYTM